MSHLQVDKQISDHYYAHKTINSAQMRTNSNGALKFQKSTDSSDNLHKSSIEHLANDVAQKYSITGVRPHTNESRRHDFTIPSSNPLVDKQKMQSLHAVTGNDGMYGTGSNFRGNQNSKKTGTEYGKDFTQV